MNKSTQKINVWLQMLMNVINLSQEAHSTSGRSLDAHLLHRFGAEFHAPLLLQPPHPNVVRVRHHYQGDTTHFRCYLPLLMPVGLDVPVEMARRTTFLVLDHYPQTLHSLFSSLRYKEAPAALLNGNGPVHNNGKDKVHAGGKPLKTTGGTTGGGLMQELPADFVVQLTWQLLSAVEYLQSHGVVHRDIKADNVFLDARLRPVLGDFGFARTVRGYDGQALPLTDNQQMFAGNADAWAPELCRLSRADILSLPKPVSASNLFFLNFTFVQTSNTLYNN
jgi:serine/threonine protein kinase